MRSVLVLSATLALVGCQRIDSNRTGSLDDHATPGPRTADSARPGTNRVDNAPAAGTSTAPGATGPATGFDNVTGSGAVKSEGKAGSETDVSPSNTAVNERDREPAAKTPLDQGENEADRNTTAEIRQRIVNAENMSINARNVKIITSGGKVTLRGPVNSAAERESIVRFAREVAGEANVEDQLEVAAANTHANP